MNQLYPFPFTSLFAKPFHGKHIHFGISIIILLLAAQFTSAQAVSGIITDYNGYWKSSTNSVNTSKPQNDHNVLAFSYNGATYSTGVNDALLASHGETFVGNDFWSLPVGSISGHINGNTKVGVGQMHDGTSNGPNNQAISADIASYLTDGIKGLNIGTCIANLPVGSMTFLVNNIKPASIGDGVPDILVTQVADPSNSFDRYHFTDASGNQIGNYKDIVFTSITPVGNWTADFYEASTHPKVLTPGFTNTDRPMRLWAADLSEFGITAANYASVTGFKIGLSGNSDVAFVAYSARSFNVSSVLPVTLTDFSGNKNNHTVQLKWNTRSEDNLAWFIIEKSVDNRSFTPIDSVKATGHSSLSQNYSYTDHQPGAGENYYRLKMKDEDGRSVYSNIISIKGDKKNTNFSIYPNPAIASGTAVIRYDKATGNELLKIYNSSGLLISRQTIAKGSYQSNLSLSGLTKGIYYIVFENGMEKETQKLLVD